MSEARDLRFERLEEDVREIKATLAQLLPLVIRVDERLNSTLPQLATKAELADVRTELADKPGKTYLATAIGVLLVAYAAGLAGLAALPVIAKVVQ
jgi:hypothetical protein